jgi:hypothetical protein
MITTTARKIQNAAAPILCPPQKVSLFSHTLKDADYFKMDAPTTDLIAFAAFCHDDRLNIEQALSGG